MSEIKINIKALEGDIKKLNSLSSMCRNKDRKIFYDSLQGAVAIEIEEIVKISQDLNTEICFMIDSTAQFMENVKDSYISSDKKAKHGMSGSW